ncbi:MAG: 4Fe-4S binding protein [Acidimicrobiales bacterium]
MQSREIPVVVICGDVGAPPVPLRPGELAARLRRELPGVTALLLGEICETPQALSEGLAAARPNRVVVACRADPQRHGELRTRLRSAGAPPAGTEIVDLKTADGCSATVALEQSVALVSAAVVRVAVADVTAPVRERTSLSVGGVTRRSLLRGVNTARHFVAVWRPERCTTAAACTACVLACPHGALRQQGRRVVVDGDRCTGCGACVACCRNAALVLPGAELEGLGAAAAVLGAVARRDGSVVGVSIVCRHAEPVPLIGEAWLVLRVPSVEMVTAGWILQLVSAGVNVRVLGCKDQDCETRASDLEGFVRALMQALGFSEGEAAFIKAPAGRESAPTALAPWGDGIELREPEATMQALSALRALGPARAPWRVEGAGCSLGVVGVDPAGCSLCEVCVGVCPTGAFAAERDGGGVLHLSVDSSRCNGCGACVTSCPEAVISVERAADAGLLSRRGQVVATGPVVSCERCGVPLVAGPQQAVLRRRLGGSHPNLTSGSARICADCRLGGRSATGSRSRVT